MTSPDDPKEPGQPTPQPEGSGHQPPTYPPVTGGGQPPSYPPPVYPPVGAPGAPGAPFPGGPVPGGPAPYAGSPYEAPQKKSRRKLFLIIGGVAAVLLVAIVIIGVVASKGTITDIKDAKAGDCITVSGTSTDATPKTIDCGSDTFNFVVAEQLEGDATCANEQYSQLTQKDKGKLCLVPNMRTGKCYQLAGPGGSITDFTEAECGTEPAAGGAQVVTIINRVDSTDIDCTDGIPVTFEKPAPLSYCLAVGTGTG